MEQIWGGLYLNLEMWDVTQGSLFDMSPTGENSEPLIEFYQLRKILGLSLKLRGLRGQEAPAVVLRYKFVRRKLTIL